MHSVGIRLTVPVSVVCRGFWVRHLIRFRASQMERSYHGLSNFKLVSISIKFWNPNFLIIGSAWTWWFSQINNDACCSHFSNTLCIYCLITYLMGPVNNNSLQCQLSTDSNILANGYSIGDLRCYQLRIVHIYIINSKGTCVSVCRTTPPLKIIVSFQLKFSVQMHLTTAYVLS